LVSSSPVRAQEKAAALRIRFYPLAQQAKAMLQSAREQK
jgi:hypothetical protein